MLKGLWCQALVPGVASCKLQHLAPGRGEIMIRGIYSSAMGMNVQSARLETVSNNLANVSTPGFKKDHVLVQSFPHLIQLSTRRPDSLPGAWQREVLGVTGAGAAVSQVVTNFSQGSLRETGNPANLALTGSGYFVLTDPENEDAIFYSRNGSFQVDSEGYLVNDHGYRLMGDGGPVQLEEDPVNFTVDESGNITENGTVSNTIYVVDFENPSNLQREGRDFYRAGEQEPQPVETPALVQRYLEGANVDLVEETVNLTTASRAYETGQKIIQAQDGMLGMAINSVGKLR